MDASWLWHYDDCPKEYLKFVVYLNSVDENNGCFQYISNSDDSIPVMDTGRVSPFYRKQIQTPYEGSRIPQSEVQKMITNGKKITSLIGEMGTYAVLTPNIIHRATVPKPDTTPRDCIFFFIRPCLTKRKSYINEGTKSILPRTNVKTYELN